MTKAVVVAGAGGPDELTCAGPNIVITVHDHELTHAMIDASDVDLDPNPLEAIKGGSPEQNAETLRAVLEGKPGPVADCVLFNAGAAFVAAEHASTIKSGVEHARAVIADGKAVEALDRYLGFVASL